MGTTGKQGRTKSAADLLQEARRLSKKYSTDYVDVLEPSNSGRSPVVRRMHVDELREPLAQRNPGGQVAAEEGGVQRRRP